MVVQARTGRVREITVTQYRGMDSYLPRVINQSESKILSSCCKKYLSQYNCGKIFQNTALLNH
jgi:hypothetical protein